MKPAAIDASAVYVTPTGRRCRWVPSDNPHRAGTAYAFFQYLGADGAIGDGFNLSPSNYGVLRKERPHAPPR